MACGSRISGQYDDQIEIFSGCGGASAYRKDVWQSLGGFDEDLWMYLEDVDYGFRAQLTGYPAVFAPQARVYHHLSASGGDLLASYFVGRNTIWVIAKNMPRSLLRRNLGPIVGAQLQVALDALANYRGAADARAPAWPPGGAARSAQATGQTPYHSAAAPGGG